MKILMICIGLPTKENPSRGIFNLRTALQIKNVCDIELVFLRTWIPFKPMRKSYHIEGIKINEIRVPYIPLIPFAFNIWLAQRSGWLLIKKFLKNVDILHSVSAEYSSILGSYWSKKSGIKHIAQLIGSDINSALPVIKDLPIVKKWTDDLDGVVCNSNALKKAFFDLYPSFKRKVVCIYRGTDIKKFVPPDPDTRYDELTCLFVGGFNSYASELHKTNLKGGYSTMEFWEKGEEVFKKMGIKLHMAGGNVIDNKDVLNWFSKLKYPEQVKLSPFLSHEQILRAYHQSILLLLPSKEEGLPNAGTEAAACGCVIIGNNVGGIPEIVEDEKTGIIIKRDDSASWCEAVIMLCNDKEKLKVMSRGARNKTETAFDSLHYGNRIIELYKNCLEV